MAEWKMTPPPPLDVSKQSTASASSFRTREIPGLLLLLLILATQSPCIFLVDESRYCVGVFKVMRDLTVQTFFCCCCYFNLLLYCNSLFFTCRVFT